MGILSPDVKAELMYTILKGMIHFNCAGCDTTLYAKPTKDPSKFFQCPYCGTPNKIANHSFEWNLIK